MNMKEIDAIHLSESHGLGSERNTLVPGVMVPAYQPGTDPDKWIANVKAIGISRYQPSSSAYSLYAPVRDGVGSLPGYSGLDNTTIQKKSPEEQAQVIARLAEVLQGQGNDGGGESTGRFDSGRWLFGNDFGSLQSASLASAAQDAHNAEAARNFNLQQQQLAQRAKEVALASQRQASVDSWTKAQQVEANRLALLDRLTQAGQQEFENNLNVARVTGANADNAAYTAAGGQAVEAYSAAAQGLSQAQSAWNQRVYDVVQRYNDSLTTTDAKGNVIPAGDQQKLMVVEDSNGIAKLVPGKMAGAGANKAFQELSTSPEAMALQKAHDNLTAAQVAQQKVQFTPRTPVAAPALPQNNNAALLSLLASYGFALPQASTPAARGGPVPYATLRSGGGSSGGISPTFIRGAGDLIGSPMGGGGGTASLSLMDILNSPAASSGSMNWSTGSEGFNAPTSMSTVPKASSMPVVRSQAEFNRLPPGTYYRTASGGTGYKP